MSNATKGIDTAQAMGGGVRASSHVVKAGSTVYAGTMVAVGTDGYAVPAADAAGLQVVGIAQSTASAGETVRVVAGDVWVNIYPSSGMSIGSSIRSKAYVKTDNEVALAGEVTNNILAGVVYDFSAAGKARVDVGGGAKA